jgi:hypothetical protein
MKNEQRTIKIIEEIFGSKYKFEKSYPAWLKSSSGAQLELDGFNEQLAIGVEYNGPYHYDKKYYPTEEKFNNKVTSDQLKVTLCKMNGVLLIVIPYTVSSIYDYILSRLYDNNYQRKYVLPSDYLYMDFIHNVGKN